MQRRLCRVGFTVKLNTSEKLWMQLSVVLYAPQMKICLHRSLKKSILQILHSESESSLTITWRFLGFLSLFKSSATRLKVNEHLYIFPIVAPEKRSGVADAVPGVFGESETKALELALLADAVDIASSLVVAVLVVDFRCSERISTSDIFR